MNVAKWLVVAALAQWIAGEHWVARSVTAAAAVCLFYGGRGLIRWVRT